MAVNLCINFSEFYTTWNQDKQGDCDDVVTTVILIDAKMSLLGSGWSGTATQTIHLHSTALENPSFPGSCVKYRLAPRHTDLGKYPGEKRIPK